MNVIFKSLSSIKGYITKDNSLIYEILNPKNSPVENVSVALAIVNSKEKTLPHKHLNFDEIYFVIDGDGVFISEGIKKEIRRNDLIFIPRGTIHFVEAGKSGLKILCICIPPYSHDSTVIVE